MNANEAAWVIVAENVLNGRYEHADNSTLDALNIGLRAHNNPKCKLALERLTKKKKR